MPELPEVETIVRQLRSRGVEGRRIEHVMIHWPRTVEPLEPEAFCNYLTGRTICSLSRVGKWMLFSLDNGQTWMVHLRMSGSFSTSPGSHDRAVVNLSGGLNLYYRDTRKFGRWKLVDDPQHILAGLGPDALSRRFSRGYFAQQLGRRHRALKPLLLDQTIVAGLGNIYVDEALWQAQLHPMRRSDELHPEETERLFRAIRDVLRTGVKNRGTSLGGGKTNYRDLEGRSGGHREKVKAYGRAGKACERCGNLLEKTVIGQRTSTFCPVCQPI